MITRPLDGAGAVIYFGCLTASNGEFVPPGTAASNSASGASEADCAFYAPRSGTLRNLVGFCGSSGGALTIRKNLSSDTSLTVSSTQAVVTDSTHTVSVARGDYISLKCTGTLGGDVRASVEFV